MITKKDLVRATQERTVIIEKNFCSDNATWKDIEELYNLSKDTEDILYSSFGAMVIRNADSYVNVYKNLVKEVSEIHGGRFYGAMSIVHFINRNNNKLTDPNSISLSKDFYKNNPHPWPEDMDITEDYAKPEENFNPTVHADDADGMFIQGDGSTLWRFYEGDKITQQHTIETGDLIYIPKNIIHSVESLSPRHSISISFSNDNIQMPAHLNR